MQDILIEAGELTFRFENRVILNGLSFQAEGGRIYGLFGANGSGKTTLFNVLCGFYKPTVGWIRYYGEDPGKINPLHISKFKAGLARSFQIPVVVDDLSVSDNLLLAYRLRREGFSTLVYKDTQSLQQEATARDVISQHLDDFGLANKSQLPAGILSYGERRLISNLRTVLTGSRIILMDEPFSNLNSRNIEKFKRLLQHLAVEERRLVMLIEHVPDNLLDFADTLLQLHRHKLTTIEVRGLNLEALSRTIQGALRSYE